MGINTLQAHLLSPEVSLDEHVHIRQIELARLLASRKAIYLDVKYWIILRDVIAGIRSQPDELELLKLLRKQVEEELVFCPISESTFAELYKQKDAHSRQATAQLIDELSLGIALIPHDERVRLEFSHLIRSHELRMELPPLRDLVWSKLSFVLGFIHPYDTGFDPATELAIQKAFFDHLWDMSLSDCIQTIGASLPAEDEFHTLADRLNVGNAAHSAELSSYEGTYVIELKGALESSEPMILDVLRTITENAFGVSMPNDNKERDPNIRQWLSLIFAAFKKDTAKMQEILRTTHIGASLHAYVRWNKGHQFKGNDIYDILHATAALGYCDVFLTERRLGAWIKSSKLALDRQFNCIVASDIKDAIALLQ